MIRPKTALPSVAQAYEISATHSGSSCHKGHFSGWKFGAAACTTAVGIVLIANTVMTALAIARDGFNDGLQTIYVGDCTYAKRLNLLLHLLINIIGTILLSASNYCMQTLSSPSREAVDKAHKSSRWLHIGIPNIRNLRFINRPRLWLWILIGVSSLPLHLMLNSAIFSAISANEYSVLTLTADYTSSNSWTTNFVVVPAEVRRIENIQQEHLTYQRLERDSCIREYGKQYLAGRSHVILISTSNSTDGQIMLDYQYSTPKWDPWKPKDPFFWICGNDGGPFCDVDSVLSSSSWVVADGVAVDYCFSKTVVERCQVFFNSGIMIIVIFSNLVKFLCMGVAAIKHSGFIPLVTIGDAIASFLEAPDTTTKSASLATKDAFRMKKTSNTSVRIWTPRRRFWFHAIGRRGLTAIILISFGSLLITGVLLKQAINHLATRGAPTDLKSLWMMGLGTVNIFSLVFPGDWGRSPYAVKSIIGAAVLVNIPQLILSLHYYVLNTYITCMLVAQEWNQFAFKKKSLRVTSPIGEQRSTYFLQLPYRFAVPLLFFSALLHWLVSQSFFLAKVVALDGDKVVDDTSTTMFGFSAVGIIFTLVTAFILLFGFTCLALRRYSSDIPLVSTNSRAISAACHPLSNETNIASKRLRWGVVGVNETGIQHCAFSSRAVEPPVQGQPYI